jgi:hypothetical protein
VCRRIDACAGTHSQRYVLFVQMRTLNHQPHVLFVQRRTLNHIPHVLFVQRRTLNHIPHVLFVQRRTLNHIPHVLFVQRRTLNHIPHVLFVQVTLSTDNPSFYASTLSDEYALCCRAHRLTFRQLVELARGAIEFTFAPERVKVRCVDTHTHTRACTSIITQIITRNRNQK